MVPGAGIEPATNELQRIAAKPLEPGIELEPGTGIEPVTSPLQLACSSNVLTRQSKPFAGVPHRHHDTPTWPARATTDSDFAIRPTDDEQVRIAMPDRLWGERRESNPHRPGHSGTCRPLHHEHHEMDLRRRVERRYLVLQTSTCTAWFAQVGTEGEDRTLAAQFWRPAGNPLRFGKIGSGLRT